MHLLESPCFSYGDYKITANLLESLVKNLNLTHSPSSYNLSNVQNFSFKVCSYRISDTDHLKYECVDKLHTRYNKLFKLMDADKNEMESKTKMIIFGR